MNFIIYMFIVVLSFTIISRFKITIPNEFHVSKAEIDSLGSRVRDSKQAIDSKIMMIDQDILAKNNLEDNFKNNLVNIEEIIKDYELNLESDYHSLSNLYDNNLNKLLRMKKYEKLILTFFYVFLVSLLLLTFYNLYVFGTLFIILAFGVIIYQTINLSLYNKMERELNLLFDQCYSDEDNIINVLGGEENQQMSGYLKSMDDFFLQTKDDTTRQMIINQRGSELRINQIENQIDELGLELKMMAEQLDKQNEILLNTSQKLDTIERK